MSIINAVQKGNMVVVYNERNSAILTLQGKLHGFTGSTVSVKSGNFIAVYNERGSVISTVQG
jgi:hypothetical protein